MFVEVLESCISGYVGAANEEDIKES